MADTHDSPDSYSNIRDFLGVFRGLTLLEVSQHDAEEYDPATKSGSYVELLFDQGARLKFPVGDEGFALEHPDKCDCVDCTDSPEED